MKKLITVVLSIIVLTSFIFGQGNDCSDPIIVNIPADLNYHDNYQATCGRGNNYDRTDLRQYDSGEDIIYELNVSSTTEINIIVSPYDNSARIGVLIKAGCPTNLGSIDMSSGTGAQEINNLTLNAGSYILMIDSRDACITDNFNLVISEVLPALPQVFEFRITEDTDGLLAVEAKCTDIAYLPNTTTILNDIDFTIRWNPGTIYSHATDVTLMCTDYNIEERNYPYYDYLSTDGYYLRTFTITNGEFNCPSNWTFDEWETLATFRAREIVYWNGTNYVIVTSEAPDHWSFELAPSGWLVTSDESDPKWAQNHTTAAPTINGDVTNYVTPTAVQYTWQGGDNSYPYDGDSWNNSKNWVNSCGRTQTWLPGPMTTCIIPGGHPNYPKYPRPLNGANYISWCHNFIVENGGQINWEGAGGWTELMTWDHFNIEAGGIMNVGDYGWVVDSKVNPTSTQFPNDDSNIDGTLNRTNTNGDIFINGNLNVSGTVNSTYSNSALALIQITDNLNINSTNGFNTYGWLTVGGNTSIGAHHAFRIEADENGVGSFGNIGSVSYPNNGSAVVEVYVDGDQNLINGQSNMHLIGPTVKDISYGAGQTGVRLEQYNMTTLDTYAYEWNPSVNFSSENPWVNVWPFEYNVPVADGLAITNWYAGDGTMEMEGTMVVNTVTDYNVHNDGGNYVPNPPGPDVLENWELISNPYPSAISFPAFYAANSSIINNKFRVYSGEGGIISNWADYVNGVGITPEIQVGQGFLISINENVTGTPALTFNNSMRIHDDVPFRETEEPEMRIVQVKSSPVEREIVSTNTRSAVKKLDQQLTSLLLNERFHKKPAEVNSNRDMSPNLLEIKVGGDNNSYTDATYISFKEEATAGYDVEFEMVKWNSNNTDATMIRSIAEDGTELSINALPLELLNHEMASVLLHFQCGYDGTYTFTFSGEETFELSTEIWLEDKLENNFWYSISETNPAYTFTGLPTDQTDRFVVHFFGPTGVDENISSNKNAINIYSSGNELYVISDSEETINEIAVYNMLGSKIIHVNTISNNINKLHINSSTGYYVIRVLTDKNVYSEKVFIME